jgi:hypothetical protein
LIEFSLDIPIGLGFVLQVAVLWGALLDRLIG